MASNFGNRVRVSIYGETHGPAIGAVIDGLPAGEYIDMDAVRFFLARRRPKQNGYTTSRNEEDVPVFLSGVLNNYTTGSPLCVQIKNTDSHSTDYKNFSDQPRPSHADYTARSKFGLFNDFRGGGHFSGRLTAPLCAVGSIALQILQRKGISIGAHLLSVGAIWDDNFPIFPTVERFRSTSEREIPVLSDKVSTLMRKVISDAVAQHDSVGGRIECACIGVPAGLGDPMFEGLENLFSKVLFGIPGVKGVEFGAGFSSADEYGSNLNDEFYFTNQDVIQTNTNYSGGIQGGISNGMPIVFRVAMKPTPSIGLPQQTVSLDKKTMILQEIHGRHDPCIALRAVPVVEAVSALVLLDVLLQDQPITKEGEFHE